MSECGICSSQVAAGVTVCPACGFALPVDGPPPPARAPSPARAAPSVPTLPGPPSAAKASRTGPKAVTHASGQSVRPTSVPGPSTPPAGPSVSPDDATTAQSARLERLTGTIVAGKYYILELIGEGGMGQVYKARHLTLDTLVCVKILRNNLLGDATVVARFEREAKSASRLKHPNSIHVIDFGQLDQGGFYIVMDFVSGKDLAAVLAESWPLGEERVCHIIAQVLSALSAAHRAQIVHRDLKPENIMLESIGDDQDFATVLDFGIAKLTSGDAPGLTRADLVTGTPQYMSPEQATGAPVDGRADLYAVGVILYRMVTGFLPFEGRNPMDYLTKHATEKPMPPRARRPDAACTPALETLILRALEKDPAKRPQTAEDFRRELVAIGEAARPRSAAAARERGLFEGQPPPASAGGLEETLELDTAYMRQEGRVDEAAQLALERRQARRAALFHYLKLAFKTAFIGGALTAALVVALPMIPADWIARGRALGVIGKARIEAAIRGDSAAPDPGRTAEPPPDDVHELAKVESAARPDRRGGSRATRSEEARGRSLMMVVDAGKRCPRGMALVPSGLFSFGEKETGAPTVFVNLPDYCVDLYEYPGSETSPPLVGLSADDASSRCTALGKRLCTEEEWEHACKGPSNGRFPYGPAYESGACNATIPEGPAPAIVISGSLARCVSTYGVFDLAGNVAEWTTTNREQGAVPVLRGGSMLETDRAASCTARTTPQAQAPAGFRCCAQAH